MVEVKVRVFAPESEVQSTVGRRTGAELRKTATMRKKAGIVKVLVEPSSEAERS